MEISLKSPSFALNTLAVLAIGYTLYFARALLFPVALAVMLFLLFRPVTRVVKRFGVPSFVSAGLIVGGLVLTVAMLGSALVGPAAKWIDQAPESLGRIESRLDELRAPLTRLTEATRRVDRLDLGAGPPAEETVVQLQPPRLSSTLLNVTGNVAVGAFLTTVLLFFLLAKGDILLLRGARLASAPTEKTLGVIAKVEYSLSRYLATFSMINLCLGVVIGSAMALIGLPNPVLWGVMAALLNFVPYVGATVGAGVVFLVALLTFDSAWYALVAPAAYFGINAIEGYLVTPNILGRWLNLSPLMVFLAIFFWGWIWGVGGALLAVPLLAAAKMISDSTEQLRPLGRILGD